MVQNNSSFHLLLWLFLLCNGALTIINIICVHRGKLVNWAQIKTFSSFLENFAVVPTVLFTSGLLQHSLTAEIFGNKWYQDIFTFFWDEIYKAGFTFLAETSSKQKRIRNSNVSDTGHQKTKITDPAENRHKQVNSRPTQHAVPTELSSQRQHKDIWMKTGLFNWCEQAKSWRSQVATVGSTKY